MRRSPAPRARRSSARRTTLVSRQHPRRAPWMYVTAWRLRSMHHAEGASPPLRGSIASDKKEEIPFRFRSPAGLAYVYKGTNFADIFVTDDHGQNQVRLTNSASSILDNTDWNFRPTFSPDGKLIAFISDKTSTFPTLWLMNAADGSGRRALATP